MARSDVTVASFFIFYFSPFEAQHTVGLELCPRQLLIWREMNELGAGPELYFDRHFPRERGKKERKVVLLFTSSYFHFFLFL